MKTDPDNRDEPLKRRLSQIDRRIRRDHLRERIRELGGIVGGPEGDEVSEVELHFLERIVEWETGPRMSHRAWLARKGLSFMPPAELEGSGLTKELWRLIRALAGARVFLYHTNHLSDAELYDRLWKEVLSDQWPDSVRTGNDAWICDFAEAGEDGGETWLRFYASPADRRAWCRQFPETVLPERSRPPFHRDRLLPAAG